MEVLSKYMTIDNHYTVFTRSQGRRMVLVSFWASWVRELSKVIHRLILPNEFAKWGVASLNGFSNKSVKSAYSRIVWLFGVCFPQGGTVHETFLRNNCSLWEMQCRFCEFIVYLLRKISRFVYRTTTCKLSNVDMFSKEFIVFESSVRPKLIHRILLIFRNINMDYYVFLCILSPSALQRPREFGVAYLFLHGIVFSLIITQSYNSTLLSLRM